MRGETGDAVEHLGVLVLFGVSAFVRLYKAKSLPEGLTPIAPAALGLASAKQPPSSTRSDVAAGAVRSPSSPLSWHPTTPKTSSTPTTPHPLHVIVISAILRENEKELLALRVKVRLGSEENALRGRN